MIFCTNVYVVLVGIYGSKYEVWSWTIVTKQEATGKTEESRIRTIMVFPFILVLQCVSFIMSLSTAAIWRRKPAPARTSRDSCRVHKRKKHPVCSRIYKHCLAVLRVRILSCGLWCRSGRNMYLWKRRQIFTRLCGVTSQKSDAS